MEENATGAWPGDVVGSLWNDDVLENERIGDVPLSGITFDTSFLLAFAAGCLVIMVFAWSRFRERSYDESALDYRVMTQLAPTDLRAKSPIGRAYTAYVGCILAVYAALTFFGDLIVQMLNYSPVAGIQINPGGLTFDDPNWPLTLAFAFAGFLPLFKFLQRPEEMLRVFTHQLAGIPIRIEAHTRNLIRKLQDGFETADGGTVNYYPKQPTLTRYDGGKAVAEPETPPDWIVTHFGITEDPRRYYNCRDEIELIVGWLKEHQYSTWPEHGIRQKMKPLVDSLIAEAANVLNEFENLIVQNYNTPSKASRERHALKNTDALAAHQGNLRKKFRETTDAMERLRNEFASVLTVYAERDGDFEEISNPNLRRLLQETFPPVHTATGLERSLFFAILLAGLVIAGMTWTGWHPTLNWKDPSPLLLTWTTITETLRFLAYFLFPVLAVMSWRFFLVDREVHALGYANSSGRRRWIDMVPFTASVALFSQLGRIIALAALVCIIGLVGVALLAAVIVSEDEIELVERFIDGDYAFVYFYTSYAAIGVVQALAAVVTVEWSRTTVRTSAIWLTLAALLNGVVTMGVYYLVSWRWALTEVQGGATTRYEVFDCATGEYITGAYMQNLFNLSAYQNNVTFIDCFFSYSGLDYLLCLGLAMLVVLLAWALSHTPLPEDVDLDEEPAQGGLAIASSAIAVIAVAGLWLLATALPSWSEDKLATQAGNGKIDIVVGFRTDAEPFSYQVTDAARKTQYIGYIADLCHYIFHNSIYEVHARPIAISDREALKGSSKGEPKRFDPAAEKLSTAKIDVLCDPITIRFLRSEHLVERPYLKNGIFSPIVFTSGVSYLDRREKRSEFQPSPQTIYLGYVAGSTAEAIVKRACETDLFEVFRDRSPFAGERKSGDPTCDLKSLNPFKPRGDCAVRSGVSEVDPKVLYNLFNAGEENSKYVLCGLTSHTEAISWFCSARKGTRPRRIYFGDRDIIVAKLKAWRDAGKPCPAQEIREKTTAYSYEPYGILVSMNDPQLVQHVQQRVYEFFSHSSKAKAHFAAYFDGTFSKPLAYLFLLNAVDHEKHYTSSSARPAVIAPGPDKAPAEAPLDKDMAPVIGLDQVDPEGDIIPTVSGQ